MLSEQSQTPKDKYCMILLIRGIRQIHRDRKSNGGFQRLERGKWELLFNGYRGSVLKVRKVLEMHGGDGCTTA